MITWTLREVSVLILWNSISQLLVMLGTYVGNIIIGKFLILLVGIYISALERCRAMKFSTYLNLTLIGKLCLYCHIWVNCGMSLHSWVEIHYLNSTDKYKHTFWILPHLSDFNKDRRFIIFREKVLYLRLKSFWAVRIMQWLSTGHVSTLIKKIFILGWFQVTWKFCMDNNYENAFRKKGKPNYVFLKNFF